MTKMFFAGQDMSDLLPSAEEGAAPPILEKDLTSLEPHCYTEWMLKIRQEQIFDNPDSKSWKITKDNLIDIMDAIDIESFSENDENAFCDKYGDKTITFQTFVNDFQRELLINRGIPIKDVFDYSSYDTPLFRI